MEKITRAEKLTKLFATDKVRHATVISFKEAKDFKIATDYLEFCDLKLAAWTNLWCRRKDNEVKRRERKVMAQIKRSEREEEKRKVLQFMDAEKKSRLKAKLLAQLAILEADPQTVQSTSI